MLKPFLLRHEHVQRCLSDRGWGELIPDPSSEFEVWKSEDPIAIHEITTGLDISYFGLGLETEALAKFAGFDSFEPYSHRAKGSLEPVGAGGCEVRGHKGVVSLLVEGVFGLHSLVNISDELQGRVLQGCAV